MMVWPRGYPTTWAGGNLQPAPEMGLAPAHHGHTDPSPIHRVQATNLHPKIAALTFQATNGTMGASTQVLDQEGQRGHRLLETNMASAASSAPQPCHCPKTLCPPHSHATSSHPSTPSPSFDSNGSAPTRTSMLRHRLTFHRHQQPLFSMHLPRHCRRRGHPKTHLWFHQRI